MCQENFIKRMYQESLIEVSFAIMLHESHRSYPSRRRAFFSLNPSSYFLPLPMLWVCYVYVIWFSLFIFNNFLFFTFSVFNFSFCKLKISFLLAIFLLSVFVLFWSSFLDYKGTWSTTMISFKGSMICSSQMSLFSQIGH